MSSIFSGPSSLQIWVNPVNAVALTLVHEDGALADRDFEAFLDEVPFTIEVLPASAPDWGVDAALHLSMTTEQLETVIASPDRVGRPYFVLRDVTVPATPMTLLASYWVITDSDNLASNTTTLTVTLPPDDVRVAVAVNTPDPNGVKLNGDQTIAGTKEFLVSPVVPNPATPALLGGAASKDEVQDLIGMEPVAGDRLVVAGGAVDVSRVVPTMRSMNPQSLSSHANSTSEANIATGVVIPAGELVADSMALISAGGFAFNNSGTPRTTTYRLRCHDGTNDRILASWAVPMVHDTDLVRPWTLLATINFLDFIGFRPATISQWGLGAGAAAPALQESTSETGITIAAGVALTWRITAQHSFATTSLSTSCTAALMTTAGLQA